MRLKVSNVCQLLDKSKYPVTKTDNGVTYTNNGDGTITVNGTATDNIYFNISGGQLVCTPNKKYLLCGCPTGGSWSTFNLYVSQGSDKGWLSDSADFGNGNVLTGVADATKFSGVVIFISKNQIVNNLVYKPQLFDLTEMYGAGHEPTTVEQFRQDFPNEMYDYSPECWKKFRRLKYVTETKNLFDVNKITESTNLKNNKDGTITVSVYGVSGGLLKNLCPELKVGNVIKVYFQPLRWTAPNPPLVISAGGVIFDRNGNSTLTVTEESLNQPVYFYNNDYGERELPGTTIIGNILITTDLTITNENYNVRYTPYGYLPLNRGKYIASKEPVQLLDKSIYSATTTNKGITITNNGDGSVTLNGTATSEGEFYSLQYINLINGHKYFIYDNQGGSFANIVFTLDGVGSAANREGNIWTCNITSGPLRRNAYFYVVPGTVISNKVYKPQIFDLTEMYGAGNEPTTVEQFRADYPNALYDYNPYNAITFR